MVPFLSDQTAFVPRYRISPLSMVSSIVAHRSRVDFPDPDGPIIDRISPSFTDREMSFSTWTFQKDFSIWFIVNMLITPP